MKDAHIDQILQAYPWTSSGELSGARCENRKYQPNKESCYDDDEFCNGHRQEERALYHTRKQMEYRLRNCNYSVPASIKSVTDRHRTLTFVIVGRDLHTEKFYCHDRCEIHDEHVAALRGKRDEIVSLGTHLGVPKDAFMTDAEAAYRMMRWLRFGGGLTLDKHLVCVLPYALIVGGSLGVTVC